MKNILIIGCGLIGSSVLRAVHSQKISKNIYIYEKSKKNILLIKKLNIGCKVINKFNIITNEVTANFLLLNFSKCKYSAKYIKKS